MAEGQTAQRCAGVAVGQTKAAKGGCRAEQPCEPRSIAAAERGEAEPAAGPKITTLPQIILKKMNLSSTFLQDCYYNWCIYIKLAADETKTIFKGIRIG